MRMRTNVYSEEHLKISDIKCFWRSRLFISVVTMTDIRKMDVYFALCSSFR